MEQRNNAITLQDAAAEIKKIYKANPSMSASSIEAYIEEHLKQDSAEGRLSFVSELAQLFEAAPSTPKSPVVKSETGDFSEQKEYSHLFTLLFGKNITKFDLSSEEHLEKLAKSLNTIFDSLNQIMGVIHSTLLGEKSEFETIRHIIGSGVESHDNTDSLQNYLDQIQRAFLIAHRAYQEAAKKKMRLILGEISPDKISESAGGGLKFGPLKKAEMFENYTEKHELCKRWLESGRLMEEMMREFEKICQKLYYSMDTKKN
jgi:hypothetical protein